MKFCPICDNLLYPTKNKLYCKFCGFSLDKDEDLAREKTESKSAIIENDEINYLNFFPYDQFRPEQENIINQIEESARLNKIILLVSPNGTGKTIIALSSLLPLAIENNLKIIYLCRTHSQTKRVIKELEKISQYNIKAGQQNITINGLSIRGRNEMCLNKTLQQMKLSPRESMVICRDLRKNRNCINYLNLLKKIRDLEKPASIAPELFKKPVDAEELIEFCKRKKLCPYFLSKFLLEEMRIIICNYQWIFNPSIQATFLNFIGCELQDCIIVIDECHNIIDVATEANSDSISPYSLKRCLKDLEESNSPILLQSFVRIILDHLEEQKQSQKVNEDAVNAANFLTFLQKKLGLKDLSELKNLINELYEYGESIHEEKIANGLISRNFLGSLAEFWLKWISTYFLDNYFFSYNIRRGKEKKTISLEIVALDPREIV
ncbi:MAG: DEAD/DEAH box helicase family protein, partial [Candidatus Hodarchaeota archaeon]